MDFSRDNILAKLKQAKDKTVIGKNALKTSVNQTANKIGNTQVLGNTLKQYGGKIGGGAGVGFTIGNEVQNTNDDLAIDGVSDRMSQGRVLEGALRVGTKTAGAIAGAAQGAAVGSGVPFVGTAAGGLIGGAIGYVAPDLVISGTGKAIDAVTGGEYALPSQQIDALRQTLQKNKQKNKAPKTEKSPNALDGTGASPNDMEDDSADTGEGGIEYDQGIDAPWQGVQGEIDALNENQAEVEAQRAANVPQQPNEAQKTNANSQQMVNDALESLKETLKNPAEAETLGGALKQKIANKQGETIANAQVKAADQLNNLATSSIGMRQGEQNLVKGEVDINNAILNAEIAAQNAELAQAKGEQELSAGNLTMQEAEYKIAQQARMEKVANQLAAETDPVKQRALQTLLLTMQGKEPKPQYEFREVGGGMEGGQQPQANYKVGQQITFADGVVREWNGKEFVVVR